MKHIAVITALALPLPALAQDAKPPLGLGDLAPFAEGLRGLMEGLADDMLPLMQQLGEKMSDLNAYEAPEVLRNGDILIRRKPDVPEPTPETPQANPDGSIDL